MVSFGQDTIYFDSKWEKSDKINAKYYRIDKKVNDLWKSNDYYLETNKVQMFGEYSSLDPEIRNGVFEWYYPNGILEHKGSYKDNKKDGEHIWYYESGVVNVVETYKMDVLDGPYKVYHVNGKINVEAFYENGIQIGNTKLYRPDGTLHSEGLFKDGDREGIWKFYDDKGNLLGTNEFKRDYLIPRTNINFKLPNSFWGLAQKVDGEPSGFIFKRESIIDSEGRDVIPAIMIYSEDASQYYQDLLIYSFARQQTIIERGVIIDTIKTPNDKGYLLALKKSVMYKCHYTDNNIDHVLYMIHAITKDNIGVQIYMDMTKELADKYEIEFINSIKSITEQQ